MWNFAASVTILLLFSIFMYVMLRNAGGWMRCSGCGRKIRKENIRVIGIYLQDQQTAAVVRGKIAKKKLVKAG